MRNVTPTDSRRAPFQPGRLATLLPIVLAVAALLLATPRAAVALDDAHWRKADAAIDKGIAYLRSTQNEDGSWTPRPGPAVTALILTVMLDQPDIASDDPAVQKAVDYILQFVQDDGGIYDRILANYNTAICLSALSRINDRPDVARAIEGAKKFLGELQWTSEPIPGTDQTVDEDHPYYGGVGYGGSGRPDMSNMHFMIQALHDAGVDCNDPVYQRALMFITRCQGTEANDMFADEIAPDGGFIYATSENKDNIGVAESKAGRNEQGRLKTYGSITYAGFMSYVYADLDRDDVRVRDALSWISKNYTLDQNPGMPEPQKFQGYYYYFMTFGRALSAWGATYVETEAGEKRDWANDLIAQVVELQDEDGSWVNTADRWMESDRNLVTAYSLIALQAAIR